MVISSSSFSYLCSLLEYYSILNDSLHRLRNTMGIICIVDSFLIYNQSLPFHSSLLSLSLSPFNSFSFCSLINSASAVCVHNRVGITPFPSNSFPFESRRALSDRISHLSYHCKGNTEGNHTHFPILICCRILTNESSPSCLLTSFNTIVLCSDSFHDGLCQRHNIIHRYSNSMDTSNANCLTSSLFLTGGN